MSLLLLHLSDIHIALRKSHVLSRARAIADAVKNVNCNVGAVIVAVTGDIAFSGQEDEYLSGIAFFDELRKALLSSLAGVPVYIYSCPGNHDCQFNGEDKVRSIMVGHLRQHGAKDATAEMIDICTATQRHFFEFRDHTQPCAPTEWGELSPKLAYAYGVDVAGKRLRVVCLNTAWISEVKEQQGALAFPPISADSVGEPCDLTITMLHHPYSWFESSQGAALRRTLEQTSQLVLTGHEHDPEQYTKHAHAGRSNVYLAGGVLSERDNPRSTFYALVMDLAARQYKSFCFHLSDAVYVLDPPGSPSEVKWELFSPVAAGARDTFGLSDFMAQFLDEPGINLTHRSRATVKLSDIFVPPDLREVHLDIEERGDLVKGQDIPGLVHDTTHILIIGDDQSGKTCLGKYIFRLHLAQGDVPVWLEGADSVPTDEAKLDKCIEEAFAKQYSAEALTAYRQLDKKKRVVIIDDYHEASKTAKSRQKMLSLLVQRVGSVVLLANDLTVTLGDLADPASLADGLAEFSYYRIQALGYARRNELVERWLALDEAADKASAEHVHVLVTLTNTLDTLIGRNYIPPYPVYVLSVLQASEAVTPIDTRASAHGYFYELFVRIALSQGATGADYDIIASYLAHLAFNAFKHKLDRFDEKTFDSIHRDFEKEFDISRPSDRLLQLLIDKRILIRTPAGYIAFKYRFTYFYFVALYMRDRVTVPSIREHISFMARHVFVEDCANILLFLSHLSKDPFIVDEMIACADQLYGLCKPATLDADVAFLAELEDLSKAIVLEDKDPREERRRMLEQRDRIATACVPAAAPPEDADEECAPADTLLTNLNAALKTIEILGQILRNFPGSLDGETKLKIARTCYGLGRRTLAAFLDLLRTERKELLRMYAQHIRAENPDAEEAEVEKRAARNATGLAWLVAFGLTKKVAISIGSRELAGTYDKVLGEDPVAVVQLVDAMIAVDHNLTLPTDKIISVNSYMHDKWFPRTILAHYVVRHCQLYNVDYREKDKLARALGIDHRKVITSDATRKLTS